MEDDRSIYISNNYIFRSYTVRYTSGSPAVRLEHACTHYTVSTESTVEMIWSGSSSSPAFQKLVVGCRELSAAMSRSQSSSPQFVIETRFTRKAFKGARLPGVSLFFFLAKLVRIGTGTCSSTRVTKEDAKFTKFQHSFPSRNLRNRIEIFYT